MNLESSCFLSSGLDSPFSSYCLLPDMLPECRILKCRCGSVGDGDDMRRLIDVQGETVQCEVCEQFSHIACQPDDVNNGPYFICHECNLGDYFKYHTPQAAQRRFLSNLQRFEKPLILRLRAGQGALARHKDFWYPVRLIRRTGGSWMVQWWRENIYATDGIKPGQISAVPIEDIRDSMWMDREGRRTIRLGRWKHACDVKTPDQILSDPTSMLFTAPIDNILSKHKETLALLLIDPSQIPEDQVIPAKSWLEGLKHRSSDTLVPYAGSLSIAERAQISNWFERHIGKDPATRRYWLGCLPLAHAFTLYIAAGLRAANPERYGGLNDDVMVKEAWLVQVRETLPSSIIIDVEKECLDRLEDEMFEVSSRAGIAGHYQWGLDVGSHQNWCPYLSSLNHGDYERLGDDEELRAGPNFVEDKEEKPIKPDNHVTKPRPKPRPLFKKALKP